MKHILILFNTFFVIHLVTTLKMKCDVLKVIEGTAFGKIKYCGVTQTEVIATTPNITIDGIDTKEDLKNIKALEITKSFSMHYLPSGLGKLLPNLKLLSIVRCGLKFLTKNDLKPLSKLQGLYIMHTNLTSLDNNLFNFSSKLEDLRLTDNEMRYVEPGTFKPLTKLTTFNFNNICHSQEANITAVDEFEKEFEKIEEKCNEKPSANDASSKIKLKCESIRTVNNSQYANAKECLVSYDINATRRGVTVDSVEGVENLAIIFSVVIGYAKNLYHIPLGLASKFTTMRRLTIGDSGLRELKSEEMRQFTELQGLYLINNELTSLERQIFNHTSNLKELVIKGHKMKYVETKIFDVLRGLKVMIFRDNLCYDKSYIKDSNDTIANRVEIYKRCKKREDEQAITLMRKSKT